MNPTMLSTVAQLSNDDLLARVKHLAGREREVTAVLIAHLAELDTRRLYLAEGCASLFTYCTQILQLSEHAAYGRIVAARASRRFPVVLEMLCEGSVNLMIVKLLAAHLTPENHRDLLDAARHSSKRQIEELVARLRPQPPVPDAIRRLPHQRPAHHTSSSSLALQEAVPEPLPASDAETLLASGQPGAESARPPVHRPVVTPLAPQRYKVQFTASAALHAKLRQAQALLRHQIPDGNLSTIFDRALTALEEAFLEFHHVVPHAAGGPATAENIQLRCRAHNGYEAARDVGRSLVVREARASYAHVAHRDARSDWGSPSATRSGTSSNSGQIMEH